MSIEAWILGLVLAAGAAAASLANLRAARARRAFARRLLAAAATLGKDGFARPYRDDAPPELDAVAAALAERHGEWLRLKSQLDLHTQSLLAAFRAHPGPCLLLSAAGKVQLVNPALCSTFHIREEEALDRPFLQVVRVHLIDEALKEVLDSGQPKSFEVNARITPQPARYLVRIEPVRTAGGAVLSGVVVLMEDITRLRHLEQVRKEFVANVSHELRTPITSIKGYVETLLEQEVPPETQKRFLSILKQEADRLHALVSDLLDLSLLEARAGPLRREPVDLRQLISDVFDLLHPQASGKEITTHMEIAPDVGEIRAHREMLEQALLNLLDNAIKYSPAGSEVRVEARRVALDHVEIAVVDNGPGIPSEHLPRIFERFYRVDKSRSREVTGTGLGLAIVRHIVQRHGGSVRAESRLGKGSRFIVTLPLGDENPDDEIQA